MASRPEYQSLADVEDHAAASDEDSALLGGLDQDSHDVPFSWIEYAIFCFLGMAMLWAWYAQKHTVSLRILLYMQKQES